MSLHEISPADYHARLRCDRSNVLSSASWLSKSVLWELAQSSLFKWRYYPKEFNPTDSMQWGSLVDCLTTTPEEVEEQVAISPYDHYRKAVAKEWRDENLAAGKIVIKQEQFDEAQKAAEMLLKKNSVSAAIFANSSKQVIIGGKILGAQIKGLLDLVPQGEEYLVDLKTTNDFSIPGFEKTMANLGYHVQGGLYLKLWNAMFPCDQRNSFRLIWQHSEPPYEVAVTEISANDLEHGEAYARHLIVRILEATKANHWPMMMEGRVPILNRPNWSSMSEEAKIQAEQESPIKAPTPNLEMEEIA